MALLKRGDGEHRWGEKEDGAVGSANLRRRSGGVQITERDLGVLGWIADQYAVRTDVLRWLLGEGAPLSESRTRAVVGRWRRAGLTDQRRVFAGSPMVVWPTRDGQRLVRPGWRWRPPSVAMLAHHHAVTVVRLALERKGEVKAWTCERALLKQRFSPTTHVPDGVWTDPSGCNTAIEVELTQKSADRLRGIVRELLVDYPRILYVVSDPAVGTAVGSAVRSLSEEERATVAALDELCLAGVS